MRRLIALALLAGCASAGLPPGGPDDHTPPKLLATTPDSGAVNVKAKSVIFKFDEVVSDRSGPTQDLNGLFLISPRDGAPRISWHRDRIEVRGHGDFRPNTAYTVTLLPGLADLASNLTKASRTIVFSTGPTFPRFGALGRVFDWSAERVAAGAVVEAIAHPDSTTYITTADSTGQFHLGPFGPGTYTLRAFIDQNKNLTQDVGELWDTLHVEITDTQPYVELLAAKRDTFPARMSSVAQDDSTTIRLTFDKPLSPDQVFTPANFRVVRADSTPLKIVWARTLAVFEADRAKAHDDSVRVADSLAALKDTSKRAAKPPAPAPTPSLEPKAPPPPKPSKPAPPTVIVLRLDPATHLETGKQYRVTATGVLNLLGYKGDVNRVLSIPKPTPVKSDSTKGPVGKPTPVDSTKGKPQPPAPARKP
ncbi:MAG TPA: Ig-like domain-containing protein [Gemmatimonadaceae bacterium]|nr:Ig-like domain-containing protein [Gemmatimonadaceae bacterium]